MGDLSAQHYLEIYRFRLKRAEEGLSHPKPQIVSAMRQLVGRLGEMSPEARVRLEIIEGKTAFKNVETGEVIGEFEL